MKWRKLSEQQLADLVMRETGEIEPVGETNEDKHRLDNLIMLTNTIDCLLDEIMDVTNARSRVEYSMKEIGDYAMAWLAAKSNWIVESEEQE
jgi:hypothetical protein